MLAVANAVLLQPLPYAESHRLVGLSSVRPGDELKQRASYPDFVDWRSETRTLDLVGYDDLETVMTRNGEPERLRALLFVGDLLGLLGVQPMLGSASFDTNAGIGVRLTPALEQVAGGVSRGLLLLSAAVGTLLLISCVNVANSLLARALDREKELAMRVALGAGRKGVARQLLLEAVLLAGLGGALGFLLAVSSVGPFGALLSANGLPRADEIEANGQVLGIAALLSLGTALLFGPAPAWSGWKIAVGQALKEGTRTASLGLASRRLSDVLVAGQIALAVLLLGIAGLFVHSFWNLNRPDPGFDPRNVLTFDVSWPSAEYPNPAAAFERLRARLLAIPGVVAASTGLQLPDRGAPLLEDTSPFARIEGTAVAAAERQRVSTLTTQPGFFRILGIPVLSGRDFSDEDRDESPLVAIVNEAFARAYLAGADPIGERLRLDSWVLGGERGAAEIVGVVADVSHRGLAAEVEPLVYLPFAQRPSWTSPVVVKTERDPLAFVPAVREAVRSIDPEQPIDDVQTLEQRIGRTLSEDRVRALLLGAFAVFAVAVAAVGLYATLSYTTERRVREIGIRMALGADASHVVRAVVGRGTAKVVIGAVVGLAGGAAVTQLVDSLLFGVSPADPVTLAVVIGVLLVVALVGCGIPARRAARADANAVLKCE